MQDDANPYRSPQFSADAQSINNCESVIRISRVTSYADRFRRYRILVDGVDRAQISAGQTIEIPVTAGEHSVVAKIDWCGSPTMKLTVDSDSVVSLECASNLQGMRVFLVSFYVLFYRNHYLALTQL